MIQISGKGVTLTYVQEIAPSYLALVVSQAQSLQTPASKPLKTHQTAPTHGGRVGTTILL